jgi:hypothetical protein
MSFLGMRRIQRDPPAQAGFETFLLPESVVDMFGRLFGTILSAVLGNSLKQDQKIQIDSLIQDLARALSGIRADLVAAHRPANFTSPEPSTEPTGTKPPPQAPQLEEPSPEQGRTDTALDLVRPDFFLPRSVVESVSTQAFEVHTFLPAPSLSVPDGM